MALRADKLTHPDDRSFGIIIDRRGIAFQLWFWSVDLTWRDNRW